MLGLLFARVLDVSAAISDPRLASRVEWHAPADCGDRSSVSESLQALVGDVETRDFEAVVRVIPAGDSFEVEVIVRGSRGVEARRFVAPSCATAAKAAALVIAVDVDVLATATSAMAIRAERDDREAGRAAIPEPPATLAPRAERRRLRDEGSEVDAREAESSREERQRTRAAQPFARIEAGVSLGILPRAAAVVHLGGGLRWRWMVADVLLGHHFARSASLVDQAGVDVGLWTATARLGAEPSVRRVSFPLLLGVALGDMIGVGRGLSASRTQHALWGAVQPSAGVTWAPLPWLAIGLQASLSLAFARPRFGARAGDGSPLVAHQPNVAGFLGTTTLELRF